MAQQRICSKWQVPDVIHQSFIYVRRALFLIFASSFAPVPFLLWAALPALMDSIESARRHVVLPRLHSLFLSPQWAHKLCLLSLWNLLKTIDPKYAFPQFYEHHYQASTKETFSQFSHSNRLTAPVPSLLCRPLQTLPQLVVVVLNRDHPPCKPRGFEHKRFEMGLRRFDSDPTSSWSITFSAYAGHLKFWHSISVVTIYSHLSSKFSWRNGIMLCAKQRHTKPSTKTTPTKPPSIQITCIQASGLAFWEKIQWYLSVRLLLAPVPSTSYELCLQCPRRQHSTSAMS